MTEFEAFSSCGALLVGLGFWGVMALPHLIRKVIGLNVMSAGVFLVLIALAGRTPGEEPDPVPQALVITGIVVAVSATALALSVIHRLFQDFDHTTLSNPEHE